jgi:hypothetical protein
VAVKAAPGPCLECSRPGGEYDGPRPAGWASVSEHPDVAPAAWTPKDPERGVLYCRDCGTLWYRYYDRQDDRDVVARLPPVYLPLLGREASPSALIAAIVAPGFDSWTFGLIGTVRKRFLAEGSFDLAAALREVVEALEHPGVDVAQAHALVDVFASCVQRAAAELDPRREPGSRRPIGSESREQMVEELASWMEESYARWDELAVAAAPKGEAAAGEARLHLASVVPLVRPLTDLDRPGGGNPAQRAAHRLAMRRALEQLFVVALATANRRRLLFLPDDQWDVLEAALDRGARGGVLVGEIAGDVAAPGPDRVQPLFERCAELRQLLELPVPDGFPLRLRMPEEGLTAAQRASVGTSLASLDARPEGETANASARYELRKILGLER